MPDAAFESVLAGQLRAYAEGGVRPFDRRAIAIDVVTAHGSAPRRWSIGLRRGFMVPAIVALTALALIATALMAGGHLQLPQFPAVVPPPAIMIPPSTNPIASPTASGAVSPAASPPFTPGLGLLTLDGDVYLTDGDAGNRQKILDGDPWIDGQDNPGGWSGAQWSGSGRYIAADLGNFTVVSQLDGSETRRFDGGDFVWAPSGDRLYVGDGQGGRVEDLATGMERYIAPPSGSGFNGTPAFSPDGGRLVVQMCTPCGKYAQPPFDLMMFDIVSGKQTLLTDTPNDFEAWPVWSPDGKAIAFWRELCGPGATGQPACSTDVYSVAATGGPELRITADSVSATPIWSPDSRHLAFSYRRSIVDAANSGGGIGMGFVTLPDATSVPFGAPTHLVTPVDGFDVQPISWTVDGGRIYATRVAEVQQAPASGPSELLSYDLTGGHARSLAIDPDLSWDVR